MLLGGVVGFWTGVQTGSLTLALLVGGLAGALLACVHAVLAVSLRVNQTVSGLSLLIVGGGFQTLEAIAALVNDEYLVVAPNYVYAIDLTAWGWIHLLIGLALVAIGICVLLGQGWALVAGIVVTAISALINFTWLPYSPLWAIVLIAIDILVIWALISIRRQATSA